MKLSRSASEKITWKTVNSDFVSREHSVTRTIEIPDGLPPAVVQRYDFQLLKEVREAVLLPFVVEGVISSEKYMAQMQVYDGLIASLNPEQPAE